MSETQTQDVDAIRDDIEQTRSEMGQTIDQIQARLAPDALKEQAQGTVQEVTDQVLGEVRTKTGELTSSLTEQINAAVHSATTAKTEQVLTQAGDTARQVGASLWERISQNPAPVALAALGIGLVASQLARDDGNSPSSQSSGQSMASPTHGAKDKASELARTAQGKAGETMEGAKQGASQLRDQAQGTIDQVKQVKQAMPSLPDGAQGFLHEQPLAAGALALGLGLVVGLSLPETQGEREAMAPVRDQVKASVSQITGSSQGLIDQAKQAAGDVATQAKETATDAVQETKAAAKDIGQTAKQSGKQAAQHQGLAG